MELLNVQPYATALQRLLRAGVCSDDQLHDYNLSQAFRGIAYAANRVSLAAPNLFPSRVPLTDGNTSTHSATSSAPGGGGGITTTGGVAVLCHMCAAALTSQMQLRTVVYLSTRLLCDEASAFGEGNERPCCTVAWTEALCSLGEKSFIREQMGIHRRLALGYVLILGGTVRAVARGCVVGKRLTSHFANFTRRILDDVLPCVAVMADARDGFTTATRTPDDNDVMGFSSPSSDNALLAVPDALLAPSRLIVEANNTILHLFHDVALDVLEVHHSSEKHRVNFRTVLDREVPTRLWPVVSLLGSALSRALCWIEHEALWHIHSVGAPAVHKEVQATVDTFTVVKGLLEAVFSQLVKQQEALECARRSVEQQFGQNAKDYHDTSDMMWSNTLRLCVLCRSVTSAWTQIHCGLGDTDVQQTTKKVLGLVASFVSTVPQLGEGEKESDVFIATTSLLSAVFAAVVVAPAPMMQAPLWAADPALTQQVHNVLVQRALRYKDEKVQKLSALLSRLILYSSSTSSTARSIAASSDQLLDLLADGRDGASQCVIAMLTRAAVERPHTVLPSLFRLLQHGDVKTRRNVLDVLTALPRACDDSAYGESFTAERMRPVLRLLSEELLLRIQDDELLVRLQSSKLFSKVWPEDVCRPLLNLATQYDRSGKRQSAAQYALRCIIEAHTEDSSIILLLLKEYLALQGEGKPSICAAPSTPGDILAFSKLHTCIVDDGSEPSNEQQSESTTAGGSGSANNRLMPLVMSLVLHWAKHVPRWTDNHVGPIVQCVVNARVPLEQELVVRVVGQMASVCGSTQEGAVALLSCCVRILGREGNYENKEEEEVSQSRVWIDDLIKDNTDTASTKDPGLLMYQMVAPLLCLHGCPRVAFASPTLAEMPLHIRQLWDILWMVILSAKYREALPADAQRLVLGLLCKFSTTVVLQRLHDLEVQYIRTEMATNGTYNEACFVCRVSFFCICLLLSQNKAVLPCGRTGADATLDNELNEAERRHLLDGAMMAGRWTEQVVMPWLLSDEGRESHDMTVISGDRRLSQASVECMALIMTVALNWVEFDDAVVEPIMRPFSQLATMCREHASRQKKGHNEEECLLVWDDAVNLLERFEFAVHVHEYALKRLRAFPSGKKLVCLWLTKYMPRVIELANAACAIATRSSRKDLAQVAAECCNILVLAVWASSGETHNNKPAGEMPHQRVPQQEVNSTRSAIMSIDSTDRNALLTFAVGSARYSSLPHVQSEGVKLLTALLGAAPEIFAEESAQNEEALSEALSVLGSVALMHPDSQTRVFAEQVLSVIERREEP
ncbi:hypothetical protein DQ04_05741010 [Trypanosoma grayi]|uniref:hypothetical protein n=1 Tax=Trypanosoma grayi TaxID=71804 RepID=UPI0004F45CE7|nr:hypothetical protein DQ04_05741010 [Trypanosoma grayi]KEG09136.1 hypothetical protein DQ04_05741010 [Trypanosoma grayi]